MSRVLSQMIGLAPWERTFVSLFEVCASRIGDLCAMLFAFLIDLEMLAFLINLVYMFPVFTFITIKRS